MKIAISGSTGLVGTAIGQYFSGKAHQVTPIGRAQSYAKYDGNAVKWNIEKKEIDSIQLAGHDVIIHLAGANIAEQRWTPAYKEEIAKSRIEGTRLLCETIAGYKYLPKLLISASAIGIYGAHDASVRLDESSKIGSGFLSEVCAQWEEATRPAQKAGVRVVHLRFGVVLSSKGGALAKMLTPFKLGLGGPIGSGQQVMSWIAIDEIPPMIEFIIDDELISGPVNAVSPNPVTNREFTKSLGNLIRRPTVIPMPSLAVNLLFGEMGRSLLLSGQKVLPKKLIKQGYYFKYPELEPALRAALSQS